MIKRNINSLPLWQFKIFSSESSLRHFVSGREGGITPGEKGSLNLSYNVGDMPENVLHNRMLLAKALSIGERNLVFPKLEHGNKVVHVKDLPGDGCIETGDALITSLSGICLMTTAADCVPVLLYDPVKKAIAAVHAGWRGTISKIVTHTIEAMQEAFGSEPQHIIAGIGPSIGPEVYEVGGDVITAVVEAFGDEAQRLFTVAETPLKSKFNLWEANKIQLLKMGVPNENIEVAGICTFSNHENFFSVRASKNSGRFAAGILLV